VKDAVAQGADDGFGPVLDAEFEEQSFQPEFHGGFTDAENVGDFLVAAAFDEQFEDFHFALICGLGVQTGELLIKDSRK